MKQQIAQGAEATLTKASETTVIKDRIKKSYRLPILDNKIRKTRTKKETKLLEKASKLIPTPKILSTSSDNKGGVSKGGAGGDFKIKMQFIKGKKLSEHLETIPNPEEICKIIGEQIAKLHDADIIHGDLTTSNMILSSPSPDNSLCVESDGVGGWGTNKSQKLYFIDFGLGFISKKIEDKAVDLHLIKQALEAKHHKHYEKFFKSVLEGYKTSKNFSQTINRLKKVEARGRYKKSH